MTVATIGLIWKIVSVLAAMLFGAGVSWGVLKVRSKAIEDRLKVGNGLFSDLKLEDEKLEKRLIDIEYTIVAFEKRLNDLEGSLCKNIRDIKDLVTTQTRLYNSYIEKSKIYQAGILSVLKIVIAHMKEDTDFTEGKNAGFGTLIDNAHRTLDKLEDRISE